MKGTIHVIAGGGGASLHEFAPINNTWSIYKDYDNGFIKLTAFDHSHLLLNTRRAGMEKCMTLSQSLEIIGTS